MRNLLGETAKEAADAEMWGNLMEFEKADMYITCVQASILIHNDDFYATPFSLNAHLLCRLTARKILYNLPRRLD